MGRLLPLLSLGRRGTLDSHGDLVVSVVALISCIGDAVLEGASALETSRSRRDAMICRVVVPVLKTKKKATGISLWL